MIRVDYFTLGLKRTVYMPEGMTIPQLLDDHPFMDDEVDCYVYVEVRFSPLSWAE